MKTPWWTEADQAELDAAIWAVVDGCYGMERGDPRIGRCLDLLLGWYARRQFVSKAEWLRRRHLDARLDEIAELTSA